MKRIFLFCMLSVFTFLYGQSQILTKNCIYGITFDFSKNPGWGEGELVVTNVEPYSAAALAGIEAGDIIMEINGKATYLRDYQTISEWLFDEFEPEVKFTIRNLHTFFKGYAIARKCININALSEQQLSEIYSFYSLENTRHQQFVLPVQVTTNPEADYTDYRSFDFPKEDGETTAIDKAVNDAVEKELKRRGLARNTSDPDIIVQAYYNYYANPGYVKKDTADHRGTWRYNTGEQKMSLLPVYDPAEKNIAEKGTHIAKFGVTFYDRKYLDSTRLVQIWDCSMQDYLSQRFQLDQYIAFHAPLMLMQYPVKENNTEGLYDVRFNRYNYTGIYFDPNNLNRIKDVDPDSPAFRAGIREGYIIRKINGRKIEYTWDSLSEGYKKFILETMKYRDEATRFTNVEGYPDCMFWRADDYKQVANEINKPEYQALFSYLYDFEPYISNKHTGRIVFEMWDGKQNRIFNITPEVRKSVVVKAL